VNNLSDSEQASTQSSRLSLDETIFKGVVNTLYRALPASTIANSVIGLSLVAILWNVIDAILLISWLSVLLVISFSRFILYKRYMKSTNKSIDALLSWDRLFYFYLILTGLTWACVSIWLLPGDETAVHYVPALILIGISAGAVTSLGFNMRYITTYFLLLLVPLFISEMMAGTFLSYVVSFLTIIFIILALSNASRISKTLKENIALHYESESHTQDLIESRNTAVAANSAKTSFISMISHELRTPLNGILGFAQLLKMSDQPPLNTEQDDQVKGIFDSGHHLLSLIEELLDLSKIESHKLNVSINDVSLANVISESVAILSPVASEYMITIVNNVENIYLVKADEKRLKQVLINLISNAIKYNHENGKVTIDVSETDNNVIRVSISDNGDGLTEEQQKELFKPFTRYNDTKEGIGLGLYITQNLVELMHGNVGVESIFKEGSTFWFELPLAEENE